MNSESFLLLSEFSEIQSVVRNVEGAFFGIWKLSQPVYKA